MFISIKNRILQGLARMAPGATTLRVWLHRARGARIGKRVFIGIDTIIESSNPRLVWIGDDVLIRMRVRIIAHFLEVREVRIENEAFIGPGAIVLCGVTIGRGAVAAAGSVVTSSVPPMTMVQGNPAVPIARCGVPLTDKTELVEFYVKLTPIPPKEGAG